MVRECLEEQTSCCFKYGRHKQMLRAYIGMTTLTEVLDLGMMGKVTPESSFSTF